MTMPGIAKAQKEPLHFFFTLELIHRLVPFDHLQSWLMQNMHF